MTSQLASDLEAIAHQHYTPNSTTDPGPSEALTERMQEKLKAIERASGRAIQILEELRSGHSSQLWGDSESSDVAKAIDELRKAVET